MVLALWSFTESIWHHRNNEVHGASIEEQKAREKATLVRQVEDAHAAYTEDHFLISREMAYLLEKHSLLDGLKMDRDILRCWLRSVIEAKKIWPVMHLPFLVSNRAKSNIITLVQWIHGMIALEMGVILRA